MSKLNKILSVILSVMLVITSIITVLPISYAESNTDSTTLDNEFELEKEYDYSEDDLKDLIANEDYIDGEIIVKYSPEFSEQSLNDIANEFDLSIEYNLESDLNTFNTLNIDESIDDEGTYVLSFDEEKSIVDLVQEVSAKEEIAYAQPNYIYKTCEIEESNYTLNSTISINQANPYQQAMLNSMNFEAESYTGENVVVAVIDSGIDMSHPALQGCFWNNDGVIGYNTKNPQYYTPITMEDDAIYTSLHGTHVAGIIAMQQSSSYPCKGIAPGVKIMNMQASYSGGSFLTTSIIKAIKLAEENGADIINMSLGTYYYDHALNIACNKAARTTVLVAAAGNEGYERHIQYPAGFSSVLGVMAYGGSNTIDKYPEEIQNSIKDNMLNFLSVNYPDSGNMTTAYFSNIDPTLNYYEIIAPGVNIISTKARDNYEILGLTNTNYTYVFLSGTSMASPIVAGIVALYMQKEPTATPGQIREVFRRDSGKIVEIFEDYLSGGSDNPEQFIPNQIDVSAILSYTPNSQIDTLFEHNNNPEYESFCNFIKSQFDQSFSEGESLTNEDIRLISFLQITSISDIDNIAEYLPLLHNLIGIHFYSSDVDESTLNYLLDHCSLDNLEVLIFDSTNIKDLSIPVAAYPKLRKLVIRSNNNLRTISNLSGFTDLAYVFIAEQGIKDLSMFTNTTNIEVLDLHGNNIVNIVPLASNTKLKEVDLSQNNITDISAISSITSLTEVLLFDNLISSLGNLLQNNNIQKLHIYNNLLEQHESEIESYLNSKEIANSNLSDFIYKPYKNLVKATNTSSYDMTIKRTDQFVVPDIVVYPYNATFTNNIELNSSGGPVKVNEYSNTIQFNPACTEHNNNSSVISYTCDDQPGSFNVEVLMPNIKSVSLEKYNFNNQFTENYVSLVTTTDTTEIKIEYLNTISQYINYEYNLFSENVCFNDYGDERIVKIKLSEAPLSDSNIMVYAGDKLGYLSSETINNNVVNMFIRGGDIRNLYGNADILLVNDPRIEGLANNAINANCDIDTVIILSEQMNFDDNSFVSANINNLYISSPYISESSFNNCSNISVFSSRILNIENENTDVIFNDDFEITNNTLDKYHGSDQEVIIPPYFGVTKIGTDAFKCNQHIKKIDLSNIDNIGNNAFKCCRNLSDVGGKLNLSTLGNYAFARTSLEDICISYINIDSDEKTIGEAAFLGCTKLKTATINCIPKIVFSDYVFKDCSGLESINLNTEQYCTLQKSCFENCNLLGSIDFECISLEGERNFANCETLSGEIIYKYQKLPDETFYNCSNISSFSHLFVGGVIIGENVFSGATKLESIGLIASLIAYKTNSFNGTPHSMTIYINGAANNASNFKNAFSPDKGFSVCADFKLELESNRTNTITTLDKYSGSKENVTIPECLKIDIIDFVAFYENSDIVSVYIPNSVTIIDSFAFAKCNDLKNIGGGKNVQYIYEYAFYNCTSLENISSLNSILYIGRYAFKNTGLTELILPNTYLESDVGAFYGCTHLKNVELKGINPIISEQSFKSCTKLERCVLSYSCTTIESEAFAGCSNLEQIYIPTSVKAMESGLPLKTKVFCEKDAPFLSQFSVNFSNQVYPNYEVVNGVLLDYQNETGYDYIDDNGKRVVDIPNAVREISDWIFFGNQNVDKVITSEYLEIIGEYAFMDCSVTEILLPETMISIGRSAFNRTGITSIDIPNGITKLEPFFLHCAPIQQVTIPESVTEICNDAFGDCQNLQSVYIPGNINSIDPNAFTGAYKPITLWGNDNSYLIQYANDNSLQNENNVIVCRLGFNIAGDALNGYTGNDINVQVPTYMQLNSIGDAAFKNNTTVESISIASGISNIGSECFSGCTSLNSLLIPDDVVCVGENAFYGIPNLTIYCNEGSYIEGYCIENNINVNTDYDISDGVLNAYNGTATNLVIPSNWFITSIGEYAFDSNTNITSVTIPEGVREIGASAFGGCSALTTVVLPASNGIKLSAVAFIDCINLTDIVNSTSITRVGNSAFGYCTSLESIDLSNVETIAAYGFDFCPSLSNVILGTSVTNIWRNAFTDCENLVINCYSNTYAHQYAIDHDIPYVLLDEITISGFSLRRSFESNATNSNSLEALEERTIPSLEDKIDDYIQQECNGKVTRDNLDDIIAYIAVNGSNNHLI